MSIEDIVAAAPPARVKPQEIGRYNPVWTDCLAEPGAFTPLDNPPDPRTTKTTFRYLWVVTDDGTPSPKKGVYRLILGIEFDDITTVRAVLTHYGFQAWLKNQTDKDLENLLDLGHPSVSARFREHRLDSEASPTVVLDAKAFFGGELNNVAGDWTINNHSGRHSSGALSKSTGKLLSAPEWTELMTAAQLLFKTQMHLNVKIGDVKVQRPGT